MGRDHLMILRSRRCAEGSGIADAIGVLPQKGFVITW